MIWSWMILTCLSWASGPALRSVEELAAHSDLTVHGRVLGQETQSRGRLIHTTYTVGVTHCLRGACPSEVRIVVPGGRVGDQTVRAQGYPVWETGDEIIAFLPREGAPRSDALLTIRDGRLDDEHHRQVDRMPLTVEALRKRLEIASPLSSP